MRVGTPGFVGERLTQARQARGLSGTQLAELLGVSPQSVSQYEHGKQSPSPEMLTAISDKLNFPLGYFRRPLSIVDERPIYWRSQSTATRAARDRAEIRLVWIREILEYLSEYYEIKRLDVPDFGITQDHRHIDNEFIEEAADRLRDHWRMREGPIPDLLLDMENNGIIVSRIYVGAETLDAFSQWPNGLGVPIVILGRDKASACRQRYDSAHELAHLLLHRHVDIKRLNSASDYKIIEDQAHYFASCFLMPETAFSNDLWSPSLDNMLSLKEKWKVSVAAMIKRCEALGIVGEAAARRLWINYNRRGWRKLEPFDGKIEKERPRFLRRHIGQLLFDGDQTVQQILSALPFGAKEIEELCDLDHGTLSGERADVIPVKKRTDNNVIRLFDRK